MTSLSPGSDKMSKHVVSGADGNALLALLHRLAAKAVSRIGKPVKIVSIQGVIAFTCDDGGRGGEPPAGWLTPSERIHDYFHELVDIGAGSQE